METTILTANEPYVSFAPRASHHTLAALPLSRLIPFESGRTARNGFNPVRGEILIELQHKSSAQLRSDTC